MVKHTQKLFRLLPTNCLSLFDHFVGLPLKGFRELCVRKNGQIVHVPHNLTNKFQPLGLSVNKTAKAYVSEKYNLWMKNEISKQLKKGTAPSDVKISLKLSVIKPLHAK